jgi:hypothetical protein
MENTRQLAMESGQARYASDKPCPKGHVGERYVRDYKCVTCRIKLAALWTERNKDKHAASTKKCAQVKKEAYAETRKNRYERTKPLVLAQQKLYRQQNIERIRLRNKKYCSENLALGAAKTARYRAAQAQRTPNWLTDDDLWLIEQAYEIAALRTKTFGFVWDVDHVFPLRGKLVSGLHTPKNLRVIPASTNRSKRNTFEVTA